MPGKQGVTGRDGRRGSVSDESIINDLGDSLGKGSRKLEAPFGQVAAARNALGAIFLPGKRGELQEPRVEVLSNAAPSFDGCSDDIATPARRITGLLLSVCNRVSIPIFLCSTRCIG